MGGNCVRWAGEKYGCEKKMGCRRRDVVPGASCARRGGHEKMRASGASEFHLLLHTGNGVAGNALETRRGSARDADRSRGLSCTRSCACYRDRCADNHARQPAPSGGGGPSGLLPAMSLITPLSPLPSLLPLPPSRWLFVGPRPPPLRLL